MAQQWKTELTIEIAEWGRCGEACRGPYYAAKVMNKAWPDAAVWTVGHRSGTLLSKEEAYHEVGLAMTRPHMRDDPTDVPPGGV